MLDAQIEQDIRKDLETQYNKRTEFRTHITVFLAINVIAWVLWAIFGIEAIGHAFPFPLLLTGFWGAGLLAHGAETHFQTGEHATARRHAFEDAMLREYGPDWRDTTSAKEQKKVRKQVLKPFNEKTEGIQHALVFFPVNITFWILYLGFLQPQGITDFPFPFLITIPWTMGVIVHLMQTRVASYLSSDKFEAEVQRELERAGISKRKRKRLADEDYLDDEMIYLDDEQNAYQEM